MKNSVLFLLLFSLISCTKENMNSSEGNDKKMNQESYYFMICSLEVKGDSLVIPLMTKSFSWDKDTYQKFAAQIQKINQQIRDNKDNPHAFIGVNLPDKRRLVFNGQKMICDTIVEKQVLKIKSSMYTIPNGFQRKEVRTPPDVLALISHTFVKLGQDNVYNRDWSFAIRIGLPDFIYEQQEYGWSDGDFEFVWPPVDYLLDGALNVWKFDMAGCYSPGDVTIQGYFINVF